MKTEKRYIDGTYLEDNPNWDRVDAAWKANLVAKILKDHKIQPGSICEVGCGSGDILRCLRASFPLTRLFGYDISPQVTQFWANDQGGASRLILATFMN